MPLISCDEAFDTRVLAARLAAQPKMLAKVLEMLDLMENAQGDLRRADEAERRVTEILRETGQELLTGWAGQVAEAVTAEARAAAPVVGHVKKKFTGIRRMARSRSRRSAFSTRGQSSWFAPFRRLPASGAGPILCRWNER